MAYLAGSQDIHVLFLGNSYTASNNLPEMVRSLALAGGDSLTYERNTPGGYTLGHPSAGHLYNATSLGYIAEGKWDFVVLQEQSQYPTIPHYRDNYFYPGGSALDSLIHEANNCTETVFFMTWGRKYGGQQCISSYCSPVFSDFEHMQDSLESAYMNMALSVDATVAPVGISWKNSILNGDPIDLFSADQSHPSQAGTYLAACTFYATFYNKSPVNLDYFGGLEESDALYLQQVAGYTVLTDPGQWNIKVVFPIAGFDFQQINDSIHFTDKSENADSYLWDLGDGTSDTVANPVHLYSHSGIYPVKQKVFNGCREDSVIRLVVVSVTKSDNLKTDQSFQVYPNPAMRIIHVQYDKARMSDWRLKLTDMTGRNRYSHSGYGWEGTKSFILPNLEEGLYILNISLEESKDSIISQQILIIGG